MAFQCTRTYSISLLFEGTIKTLFNTLKRHPEDTRWVPYGYHRKKGKKFFKINKNPSIFMLCNALRLGHYPTHFITTNDFVSTGGGPVEGWGLLFYFRGNDQ